MLTPLAIDFERPFPLLASLSVNLAVLLAAALAIPVGYRYIGSLVVSGGRHVYWYWNAEFFQVDASGTGFVARQRPVQIGEVRDLELTLKDALQYKFVTSAMTPKDVEGMIDILYKPQAR